MVPTKLSPAQKENCECPLSLKDLKVTLACMVNEKALGLDGFLCEFYKHLWDIVGLDLLYVYQEALLTRFWELLSTRKTSNSY